MFKNNFDFLSWIEHLSSIDNYYAIRGNVFLEPCNPNGIPNRVNLTTALRDYMLQGDLKAVEILRDFDVPLERRHVSLLLEYPEDHRCIRNLLDSIKLWYQKTEVLSKKWDLYEQLDVSLGTRVEFICADLLTSNHVSLHPETLSF